jgi:hypothetical protein
MPKALAAQQSFQPTLKAARFSSHLGSVGLGAAEAVVARTGTSGGGDV